MTCIWLHLLPFGKKVAQKVLKVTKSNIYGGKIQVLACNSYVSYRDPCPWLADRGRRGCVPAGKFTCRTLFTSWQPANLEQCDDNWSPQHTHNVSSSCLYKKKMKNVPAFVSKLWTLVEAQSTNDLICWSQVSTNAELRFHLYLYL